MKKSNIVAIASALMLALFIAAAYFYDSQQARLKSEQLAQNGEALIKFHSPKTGNSSARVTIVEFMDPACEACRQIHPFVKDLLRKYQPKVKLVVRYAPFHHGSDTAVKILEAAKKQGQFWEVLDIMYQSQSDWANHHSPNPEMIWNYLEYHKYDVATLKQNMASGAADTIIAIDLADAKALGVDKTPTFFVNGKALPSFGLEQLETVIKSEIALHY